MRLALIAVSAALLGGCSLVGGARADADLAAARARWAARGPAAYTMTFTRLCFCPEAYRGPFAVRVEAGRVASVALGGTAVPADRALSVDGVFHLIADAYARGAASVTVAYDAELGVPTDVAIDYDVQLADEEVGIQIRDLRGEG